MNFSLFHFDTIELQKWKSAISLTIEFWWALNIFSSNIKNSNANHEKLCVKCTGLVMFAVKFYFLIFFIETKFCFSFCISNWKWFLCQFVFVGFYIYLYGLQICFIHFSTAQKFLISFLFKSISTSRENWETQITIDYFLCIFVRNKK